MKTSILCSIAIAAAAVATSPATAQTFDGPFVGVQGGWNHDDVNVPSSIAAAPRLKAERDSVTGGGFIGYDREVAPRVVLGVEGSFDVNADDALATRGRDTLLRVEPRFSFDLGARAGYVVADRTLLYVRGGYKNMQATVTDVATAGSRRGHETFDGWSAGAGVERAITDRIHARVEYRYSDLGSDAVKYERQQVLLGVAYRF